MLAHVVNFIDETSRVWRAENAGDWLSAGTVYSMPRLIFRDPESAASQFKVGIFAGVHGDEPAGVAAAGDFIRALEEVPSLGAGYELHVYPLVNPTGFEDGTRHARSGSDLNRQFWRGSPEPEVGILEREILRAKFDGFIALHSDDTSHGFYGFARGATITHDLLGPALAAVERALPVNRESVIDGFHAVEGIIRTGYEGILSAPPETHPEPFEIVLESPSHAPLQLQRAGFVPALEEILARYRQLIAYGGEL